ncbi:AAA family ATPase, partial [Myxococcota bacterium]|nr:AAA family ATPase [Myxococcota bacterium]
MSQVKLEKNAKDLLDRNDLNIRQIERIAIRLAQLHGSQGTTPLPGASAHDRAATYVQIRKMDPRNKEQWLFDSMLLDEAHRSIDTLYRSAQSALRARSVHTLRGEGHGDLRLKMVSFEHDEAEPVIQKAPSLTRRSQIMDPAADVASLAMELERNERGDLAERLIAQYAGSSDDFYLYQVINYYMVASAMAEASTTSFRIKQRDPQTETSTSVRAEIEECLQWITEHLSRPRQPVLILMNGLPGTGKSTVAAKVAHLLGAVQISSDVIRSRLAGAVTQPEPQTEQALYSEEATERVYSGLLERARPVLQSGRTAILDA